MEEVTVTLTKPGPTAKLGVNFGNWPQTGDARRAHIESMTPGGLAAESGKLQMKDVIVSINGSPVTNKEEACALIGAADGNIVFVLKRKVDAKPWLTNGAVTEKRIVLVFEHLEMPPYDDWFQTCGISQTEFSELMTTIIESMQEFQDIKCILILLIVVTCGFGICPMCIAGEQMKSKVGAALDAFDAKHSNISSKFVEGPGRWDVVFVAPAGASAGADAAIPVVMASAAIPAVMERDGPTAEQKLTELKSLLDKGLITQPEFDSKKAEVLAAM